MIRELKLSNFRLFSDEITVRFRPITIFIGRNNAGKSSVIKFLLMLKQSSGMPGNFLIPSGGEVRLGRLDALKNKTSKKRSLGFSLEVSQHASPDHGVYNAIDDLGKKISGVEVWNATTRYSAETPYNKKEVSMGTHRMVFSTKDMEIIKRKEKIDSNSSLAIFSPGAHPQIEAFCIENLRRDLFEIKHLSAAREELEGVVEIDGSTKYVGKKGEHSVLEMWANTDHDKKDFINKHARKVLAIDNITFQKIAGSFVSCSARNIANKKMIPIPISDFGFGVSQCFPIFVQGALMPQGTHLIVEQPEAHVHPTAQLEMASFFVDLWEQYKVGSIIETHSGNMLLRIRRLIRKGDIKSDDVSVVFFDTNDNNMPVVKNLDIKSDGSMQEGLPIEFFHADIKEALEW